MAKVNVNPSHAAKPEAAGTAKKEKKARKDYIAEKHVNKKDANVYPFPSTPTDFVHGQHKPLKKSDFAKPSQFMTYKAEELESKAKKFREKATQLVQAGDGKGSNKVNRLQKMAAKMADLRKELAAQGIDVDALLAATKPAEEKATA